MNTAALLAGAALSLGARQLPAMLLVRAVAGLGSGAASVLVPRYLAEIAPVSIRGALGTLTQASPARGEGFCHHHRHALLVGRRHARCIHSPAGADLLVLASLLLHPSLAVRSLSTWASFPPTLSACRTKAAQTASA